jgi:DNA-binding Lrp family transcriptional regulator
MSLDRAAEAILALLRKHPGLSTREIGAALRLRRQDRQRAMRLLKAEGAITGRLREDRRSIGWTVVVPVGTAPFASVASPDLSGSEPRSDPRPRVLTAESPEPHQQTPVTQAHPVSLAEAIQREIQKQGATS